MNVLSQNFIRIFFFLLCNHANIMSNMHTLKDIKNRGHQLGSAYEQELEEKLYSVLKSKVEINDLSEKLVDKYSGREKEFKQIHADIGNKVSQMNTLNTELISKFTSEQITCI